MPTTTAAKDKATTAGRAMAEQSPQERVQIYQRQLEALDKMQDKPEEARAFLLAELSDGRAAYDELRSRADKDQAERVKMQEILDQQMELVRRLAEDTTRAMHKVAPRKGSITLRNFEDEETARDYALAALGSSVRGQEIMSRRAEIATLYKDFASRNLSGGSGSGDAFVVAPFANQLIGSVKKFTTLFDELSAIPMAGPSLPLRRRGARTKGYRVDAGGQITASDMGNPTPYTLDAKKYAGLSILSRELFEDANVLPALGDLLVEDHGDTIAELAERDAVIGLGAGVAEAGMSYNPGNFYATGFLYQTAFVPTTIASGRSFASVTFDDLLALIQSIDERFQGQGKFHLHRSVLFTLRGKKDEDGNYIWQPTSLDTTGSIMGFPYRTWRSAPATSQSVQAAKPFMAFGLLNKAYLMGQRQGVQFDESRDFKFDTDEIAFRSTMRMGFKEGDTDALVRLVTNA